MQTLLEHKKFEPYITPHFLDKKENKSRHTFFSLAKKDILPKTGNTEDVAVNFDFQLHALHDDRDTRNYVAFIV